jgi:hypothetical protein
VGEAIGGVRAAFMRMLDAHATLLRAELAISGKQLGIVVGLAAGALFVALLVAGLLYVGGFLFLGEWLFGSMGWGIIHGTLLGGVVIAFVGLNLAGGDVRGYGWGALVGLIVAVALMALLLSNAGNESGEWLERFLQERFVTEDLPFGEEWLVTLGGLIFGGVILAIVALVAGWRANQRGQRLTGLAIAGFIVGAFVGAIYASTRYDAADGVIGLAIMIGLITWIVVGVWLTARRGFDPEARYADLIPRESIESFKKTKIYLEAEYARLKKRALGR